MTAPITKQGGIMAQYKSKGVVVKSRDIAKILAKYLPVEDEKFAITVEEFIIAVDSLDKSQRKALEIAYVFSSKVPRQEREDMFQELSLAILEYKAIDERLAYTIARLDWINFWRKYKLHSQFFGGYLSQFEIEPEDGDTLLDLPKAEFDQRTARMTWDSESQTLLDKAYIDYHNEKAERLDKAEQKLISESLVSGLTWEVEVEGKVDRRILWSILSKYPEVKKAAAKRLAGKPLTSTERSHIFRFAKAHNHLMVS